MSGIVRNALRLAGTAKLIANNSTKSFINFQCSRSMMHMGNRFNDNTKNSTKFLKSYNLCNCGCGRFQHTQGDRELAEFLQAEIAAEKESHKKTTIPSKVGPFSVSLDGSNVTLKKHEGDESVIIQFNINHTIDQDADEDESNIESPELYSKPNFSIDIKRGKQTLGFLCSFNSEPGASGHDDSYNDIFGIDEVTVYEGEHTDTVYAAAGETMDGMLYDHLMNYLEDKGISNEFAQELVELSTKYERNAYISMLEGLAKFTSGK